MSTFRLTYTCDVELPSWDTTVDLLSPLADGISDRIDEVLDQELAPRYASCAFDEIVFTIADDRASCSRCGSSGIVSNLESASGFSLCQCRVYPSAKLSPQ